VRGALEGHRAAIARDLGELEDIMAAAVKDIRRCEPTARNISPRHQKNISPPIFS